MPGRRRGCGHSLRWLRANCDAERPERRMDRWHLRRDRNALLRERAAQRDRPRRDSGDHRLALIRHGRRSGEPSDASLAGADGSSRELRRTADRRRPAMAALHREDAAVSPWLSGVLPDQRGTAFSIAPCSISLGLTRSLLRRQLSVVGRPGTPWIRRNSSAGMIWTTRPSPSRMVTGAAPSSSEASLRSAGFIDTSPFLVLSPLLMRP